MSAQEWRFPAREYRLIGWLDVNHLTTTCIDVVLLFRWTLDSFILFLAVKQGCSGEKKNLTQMFRPVTKYKRTVWKSDLSFFLMRITFLFGIPPIALRVPQFGNTWCSIYIWLYSDNIPGTSQPANAILKVNRECILREHTSTLTIFLHSAVEEHAH